MRRHLSPLRRDPRAGGIDRRGAGGAADEPLHFHLVPGDRPRAVQFQTAESRVAARQGDLGRRIRRPFPWADRHGEGARRLLGCSGPARLARRETPGAGDRRRAGSALVRRAAARTRSSPAIWRARSLLARSPVRTCCSIRRSRKHSATSRWRRWPARCRSSPSNSTGATNLVRDGETGVLTDPGDTDAIAEALADYASNPEVRTEARPSWSGDREDARLGSDQFRRAEDLRSRHRAQEKVQARLTGR